MKSSMNKVTKNPFLLWIKRQFTTGILVFVPLVLTMYFMWVIFVKLDSIIARHLRKVVHDITGDYVIELFSLPHVVTIYFPPPGFGLVILILIIFLIGLLARNIIGSRFIQLIERELKKIPLISLIYFSVKQISYIFIKEKGAIFQRVVLIQYPREGIYAIGFTTTGPSEDLNGVLGVKGDFIPFFPKNKNPEGNAYPAETSRENQPFYSVFLPTTPNPTSGYLLYIPQRDLVFLDMNIEDAMKLIISGGTALPGESKLSELGVDL